MVPSYAYVVGFQRQTVATAITILQVKAGSKSPLELIRAGLSQKGSTTSAQESIQILRKTVGAAVTGATPALLNPNDPAAGAASSSTGTGYVATSEGTDSTILLEDGFNVLNGWMFLPTPEERIYVPAGGILAMKFPTAPASQSWNAYMVFREFAG